MQPIVPLKAAASLTEHWSPRVVADLDDSYVKVVKIEGEFVWHAHEAEDELFYVLKGELRIDMEAGGVTLREGEMFVVPKGTRHRPVAPRECLMMLIERKETLHTGDVVDERTRSIESQLGGAP
jgi:mannose-6-phosphate isomerase-like protein (cupin superfamily)